MFKVAYLLKRKAGTSLEEFKDYYETRHLPLSRKYLTYDATKCSRKYLRPRRAGVDKDAVAPADAPYDLFLELVFKEPEDYAKALAKLTAADIGTIEADEAKFMDRSRRLGFVIDEHVSPIGDVRRDHLLHWHPGGGLPRQEGAAAKATEVPKGASLFKRKPGMSHEEFKQYYENHHVLIGYKYITYNAILYSRKYLRPLRLKADPFAAKGSAAATDTPYDVFMELTFETAEGRQKAVGSLTPADIEAIRIDEEKFMDRSDRVAFVVDGPLGDAL